MASASASSSTHVASVPRYDPRRVRGTVYLGVGENAKVWRAEVLQGDATRGACDTLASPTVTGESKSAVKGAGAEDEKLVSPAVHTLRVISRTFDSGEFLSNFEIARSRAIRVNALPGSHFYFTQLVGEIAVEKSKKPALLYESLDEYLRVPVPADLYMRWQMLSNVAEALSIMHQHGLAHGDIRLYNIWLRSMPLLRPAPASPLRVKVADFGVARVPGSAAGTRRDPDFNRNRWTDCKTGDVVALGLLAYEVLSGFAWEQYDTHQDDMIEGRLDDNARNSAAYVKWWNGLASNTQRLLRLCSHADEPEVLAELLAWQTELEKSLPPSSSSSSSSSLSPTGSEATPSDAKAVAIATGPSSLAGLFTIIRRAFDHWASLAAPTPSLVASVRIRRSLIPCSLTLCLPILV